jgi:hypothetical protein
VVGLALVTAGAVTGCSSDGHGGADSARAVVDEHLAAAKAFRLADDCNLYRPDRIEAMATADGRSADGYCEFATSGLADDATAKKAATALYADATVEETSSTADRATFLLKADGGHYEESITVEKVDGGWYLASIVDNGHSHDDEDGADHTD